MKTLNRVLFVVIAIGWLPALAAAQPVKGMRVLGAYPQQFTVQYPAKDWSVVAGGSSSLVTLVHKKGEAAVVIEYLPLQLELAPSEIDDGFAQLETEPVVSRQINVNAVGARVMELAGRRAVVVDFSRQGVAGGERVRQYSLPYGRHLYRLVCSAPAGLFAKYEKTFAAMAGSFALAPAASAVAGKR